MLDVNRLRVIDAVARHGSVTAAAKELHYSQPSVSHHLARLEAETGAQLLQRAGRGIRLTQAGQLLADRAAEIIGRIDAAGAELSAHVGLSAGRVRLAAFASAIGSLVPAALAPLAAGIRAWRSALPTRIRPTRSSCCARARSTSRSSSATTRPSPSRRGPPAPPARRPDLPAVDPSRARAGHPARRDVDRRLRALPQPPAVLCADAGFEPRIGYSSDDMVVMQALVAAGLGVTTQTGLALRAHHIEGVVATELPGSMRHIYAATYGEPPDPPATAALLAALAEAAASAVPSSAAARSS